jgi:glycosyltransferase involved in cell wall biosynthesis
MALGLPVVSTRVGVEGLGVVGDRHYIEAETPSDFLRAIERLLDNPDLRFKIAECSRQFVLEQFHPRDVADIFRTALLDSVPVSSETR